MNTVAFQSRMLLGIFLISIPIFVDGRIVSDLTHGKRPTCLTEACKEFATEIKENMNESVDPCVDFYEYACGNWPRRHPIPPGQQSWKIQMIAAEENKRKIKEVLNSVSENDEIPPVKMAKEWYKACTDLDGIEKRGIQPLLNILNMIGGWPLVMQRNEWNENKYTWQMIDDYYSKLSGYNSLHDVRVPILDSEPTELTTVIDVPGLPTITWLLVYEVEEKSENENEDYVDSDDVLNTTVNLKRDGYYWKFIVTIISKIAEARGVNIPKEQVEEDVADLFNFQWKLAKLTYFIDDKSEMTLTDFQKWYDSFEPRTEKSKVNWVTKIINIFKDAKVDIDGNTILTVQSPLYFKKLVLLLDETPSRTIVNYLHWNFVSKMIKETTLEMRILYERTSTLDDDANVDEANRPQKCVTDAKMDNVIAYAYVRKFFSNQTLEMAFGAIDDIEKEVEVAIEKSNWADDTIKNFALKKLRNIQKNIAYPEWYNNATVMRNLLKGLSIGSTYFENVLNLERYHKLQELRKLKYEDDVKPWIIDPLTLNAFYLTKGNSITVTAVNFQKPFFSNEQPNTINYALTGTLLAHEICHAFDQQRHTFNEHEEEFHWPQQMAEKYSQNVQCFIEQFSRYTLDGKPGGPKIKNYGNITLEENMSDTMGLQAAYKAFKRREKINGKSDAVLPGLEVFSNDQLFFLSYANLWCENIEPDYVVPSAEISLHSNGRLRTTGSLSNNEDFAKIFNCPLGSPMNPQKKCSIWNQCQDEQWVPWNFYEVHQV